MIGHNESKRKGAPLYELSNAQSSQFLFERVSHRWSTYMGCPRNGMTYEWKDDQLDEMIFHTENIHRGVHLYEFSGELSDDSFV